MFETLEQRENYITGLKNYLNSKYDLSDTQIFIYGSFLTNDFVPDKSDIDIGIFSEDENKMYDIQYDLDNYISIQHDIVIMHLSKNLLINIPIMVYGKTLTNYQSKEMLEYLVQMINKYGFLEKGLEVTAYA